MRVAVTLTVALSPGGYVSPSTARPRLWGCQVEGDKVEEVEGPPNPSSHGDNRLVPDAGFEPATFGLQNRCSTN